MSAKSVSVAYYSRKIKTTKKSDLIREWEDAPISQREFEFLCALVDRLSYKQLSAKFNLSESGISKWKRKLYERLHFFDMNQTTR